MPVFGISPHDEVAAFEQGVTAMIKSLALVLGGRAFELHPGLPLGAVAGPAMHPKLKTGIMGDSLYPSVVILVALDKGLGENAESDRDIFPHDQVGEFFPLLPPAQIKVIHL